MTAPASGESRALGCKPAPGGDAGIEACTALIEAGKDFASAHFNRGLMYADNGDLERAIADYGAALERDPEHGDAYHNRALALIELRDYDGAAADLERAAKLKPDNASVHVDRGIVRVNQGDHDRALDDYDRALAIDPGNVEGYYARGLALAWLNRIEDARRSIERAVDLLPEDVRVDWIDSACWELGTLGRAGLALPYCDQAKAADTDAGLLDSRAFALWQLGDETAARQELQAAHQLAPGGRVFEPTRRLEEFPLVLTQGLLKGLGYDPRYIDGEPAPETTDAIRSFQQANGMAVDGEVSEDLIAALRAAQPG
ncbi:peptidoglycan-binding domain-containing protein [Denitrobaculum tricleocarpae]|nr:peptidoglycan-binding domain-containing protein [Denitrobaculum tricleocarpae]